ncbi:hypothetical protein OG292_15630 [Streptomyces sp. NBC_01511]|uniref:hypothetical protein n=1 Tax=Streptomyces sp. NBC_01511 TaxID=2903889 RepID=UPI00386DCA8A
MKATHTLTVLGAAVLAALLPASGAAADETHTNSHNGGFTVLSIGQIDDPAEDVLEHATIFGETNMNEGAEPPEAPEAPEAAEPSETPEAAETPDTA